MQCLSLPQICENLVKAANDPRVAGVFLSIEPLNCGWGKLDEIRRHLEYYKQSGMQFLTVDLLIRWI
jgi:protease-4